MSPPPRNMLNHITQKAMKYIAIPTQNFTSQLQHFYAPVVHYITGESITNYKKLAKDPATRKVRTTVFGKEWGQFVQENTKTGTKGKN